MLLAAAAASAAAAAAAFAAGTAVVAAAAALFDSSSSYIFDFVILSLCEYLILDHTHYSCWITETVMRKSVF